MLHEDEFELDVHLGRPSVSITLAGFPDEQVGDEVVAVIDQLVASGHRRFVFDLERLDTSEPATVEMLDELRRHVCVKGASYVVRPRRHEHLRHAATGPHQLGHVARR